MIDPFVCLLLWNRFLCLTSVDKNLFPACISWFIFHILLSSHKYTCILTSYLSAFIVFHSLKMEGKSVKNGLESHEVIVIFLPSSFALFPFPSFWIYFVLLSKVHLSLSSQSASVCLSLPPGIKVQGMGCLSHESSVLCIECFVSWSLLLVYVCPSYTCLSPRYSKESTLLSSRI